MLVMELEPPVRTLEVEEVDDVETELRMLAFDPLWKFPFEFLFPMCLISSELLHFRPNPLLSGTAGEEEVEEQVEEEEKRRRGKEDQEARLSWPSSFFSFFLSK